MPAACLGKRESGMKQIWINKCIGFMEEKKQFYVCSNKLLIVAVTNSSHGCHVGSKTLLHP